MFAAIRRASSLLSSLAADRRSRLILEVDIRELLAVAVADNKARGLFLDSPRRREAARRHRNHSVTSSAARVAVSANAPFFVNKNMGG